MSGFTIYETLRIFIPGALAALIVNVLLRLATGSRLGTPGAEAPADLADALGAAATFALISLVFGLLLYLIDLPEQLRIIRGDPGRNVPRPSDAMRGLIEEYNAAVPEAWRYPEDQSLSLFFLFSDRDLPDDLRKRVYLFGALFKIFVDARVLLMAAVVLGVPASASYAANARSSIPDLEFDVAAFAVILVIVGVTVLLGIAGQISFESDQRRFIVRNPAVEIKHPPYREAIGPALLLALLVTMSMLLARHLTDGWRYASLVPAFAALALWFALEIGPPELECTDPQPATKWPPVRDGVRGSVLRRLKVAPRTTPQLPVLYRTITDLAILIPALVGASVAAVYLGRPAGSLFAWTTLTVPSALILAGRKHERRLIGTYHHQLAYLALARQRIVKALYERSGV